MLAGLSKSAWLKFAGKYLFGAAVLIGCIMAVDISSIPKLIPAIELEWLFGAFVLATLGTIVLPAVVAKEALKIDRIGLSLKELVSINFAVRFYILILPRLAAIGVRWYRYKSGGSGNDAMALMVFERLVQLFSMLFFAVIALFIDQYILGTEAHVALSFCIGAALLSGFFLTPFLLPSSSKWVNWLTRMFDRYIPNLIAKRINKLIESAQAFHGLSMGTVKKILLVSLVSYILFILSPYLVVRAMDLEISIVALAWIRPLVFIMTLLPFTIAGIGVREAGFIGLLHLYEIPSHEALTLSLALFGIQIIIGIIGGLFELYRVCASYFHK